jgi:mercuric ion transport protein
MPDNARPTASDRSPARDAGALLLAASGLAAAFGAASCCVLPVLLGSLGLGGAWLVTVAWLAAPHRLALLIAAMICLVGGRGLLLWRRRASACAPDVACGHPVITALVSSALSLGAVLVALGFMYA